MKMRDKIITIIITIILSLTVSYIVISDNINLVEIPNEVISMEFDATRIFMIPIDDGYVLIDNAYENEIKRFEEYLKNLNINITEIKYVLLTHHHDDHVGFINYITKNNPNVIVILNDKTSNLISQGKNNKNNGGGIVNKRIYSLFRIKQLLTPEWDLTFPPYNIRENDIIISDDYYDLGNILGINLKVLYTPGHTSDSISFIYKDRYAFCGDLSSNFLNWAGAGYLTLFNEDINEVYKSWEKLTSKKIEFIITAHGKPFSIQNLEKYKNSNKQNDIEKFF
jgi:glyoxylase-like metal-dependent hydrolase (beta-lactamase superfamily II)